MKKKFILLILLLATAFQGIAQDTITGVVSRVAAPYFEQNVCDSRFAIIAEDETYYVMVDNYWPNPYLEDLVIHYDTIAVGNEIEVVGNIRNMEDGNGVTFQTIDINKNLTSTYLQILGFFDFNDIAYLSPDPISAASFVKYSGTDLFFITLNGELFSGTSFVFNGRTLVDDKRYLFIGIVDNRFDYNGYPFNVFELIDALPYDIEDYYVNGVLTTENDLCLNWPQEEEPYLSVFDGETHHYVTNKGVLQNRYTLYDIRNAFGNNTQVVAGGFETIHYDLFGVSFNALEVIKMETEEQITLKGMLTDAGTPYINIGPPIPGVNMSFYSNGHHYIDNPLVWDPINNDYLYHTFIVGNDTIHYSDYEEVTATFIPRMIMNNYRNPVFYILITEIDVLNGVQELDSPEVQVFPNPTDDVICISSKDYLIMHVDIMDSKGSLLLSRSINDNNIQFSNLEVHGLLFIRLEVNNGKVLTKKVIIK